MAGEWGPKPRPIIKQGLTEHGKQIKSTQALEKSRSGFK
jgi:hypothetical protein